MNTLTPLVAVIEDDLAAQKALGRVLRIGGFDAIGYSSAEEFLGSQPSRPLACLLLDIQLGGMTGLDLQRRLRDEGSGIPVIVVTALDDPRIREEACDLGCVAFLQKPTEGRVLLDLIKSLLAGRA